MDEQGGGKELIEELWPAQEPPAGFPARVLAALDAPPELKTGEPEIVIRRRRWPIAAAVVSGVAAAAAIVFVLSGLDLGPLGATAGHHLARGRDTVNIADRAIAVAVPGSELAWVNKDGAIRVDQREGTVFYRVDKGGAFVVATAAAEVRVTGTCFTVTLSPDGANGPAMSVDVLEGSVTLSNEKGELSLVAGDQAWADGESRPRRVVLPVSPGGTSSQLDESDDAGRERTAALELRVKQLERALRVADAGERLAPPDDTFRSKWFGLTKDEHKILAKRCELRYGFPAHLTRLERPDLDDLEVREDERAAVIRVMDEHRNEYLEELRALYDEIVGDPAARATLSPMGLENEIWAKARREDQDEGKRRIMQEWSGQVTPPAPGAARPSFERFMRLIVASGDDFVTRLSQVVTPDRAREIGKKSVKIMARLPVCANGGNPSK